MASGGAGERRAGVGVGRRAGDLAEQQRRQLSVWSHEDRSDLCPDFELESEGPSSATIPDVRASMHRARNLIDAKKPTTTNWRGGRRGA